MKSDAGADDPGTNDDDSIGSHEFQLSDIVLFCSEKNVTAAQSVILTEVSNANEVEESRTASRLGVKPVPVF